MPKDSQIELTNLIERHLENARSRLVDLQEQVKILYTENNNLRSDIQPIYEELLNLKGNIYELKLAFRLAGGKE